jgi:hypothetical protein
MAFTVETGTGVPGANAYDSVANIDTHHADHGQTSWDDFTTPEKQTAIVRATSYIDKRFGRRFVGVRATKGQGLEWPRLNAFDQDGFLLSDVDAIPRQLLKATAEYALRAAVCGILAPDQPLPVPKQDPTDMGTRPDQGETGQIIRKREKVGPLEEEKWFDSNAASALGAVSVKSGLVNDFFIPEYPEADMWMEELLRSSMNITLARGD